VDEALYRHIPHRKKAMKPPIRLEIAAVLSGLRLRPPGQEEKSA
jgi:hypothetical protein